MAFFGKPEPKENEKVKSEATPKRRRKAPKSEEIGFIVRREHRRQHREDRAL
ncbi:MAG: hypothetical protein HKO02_05095 [Hyphomonadaceae bacterium]|nr:hypothetical protein [Hyphomonadaceae bacterium]